MLHYLCNADHALFSYFLLQVLKHHLVPKVKGTWLVTKQLHDKFDAVYDVSVFYEGTVNQAGVRGNAPQLVGEFPFFYLDCIVHSV